MLNAAVLGSPVAHSLSPVLHRAGYDALGLTGWRYTAHEVTAARLGAFIAGLGDSWRGLSLTMPLKEAALAATEDASVLARQAGAANTLVRRSDGGWTADNTDVAGIARALETAGGLRPGDPLERVTVLGSGATARSAVLALRALGAGHVRVAARTRANAEAVAALSTVDRPGATADVVPLESWADAPGDLVVSTLPPAGALGATAALGDAAPRLLLDVVYTGWPTPLARAVGARGGTVVGGLEMLVHQAAVQFELFTGSAAPVAAMRAAGLAALAGRAR